METVKMMRVLEHGALRRRDATAVALAGAFASAKAAFAWIGKRLRARSGYRQLQALSDWQLKDIGLHRSHIWYRAYGDPTSTSRRDHARD
jgi:uncharacterized protein YjiS (DUF1127 family)